MKAASGGIRLNGYIFTVECQEALRTARLEAKRLGDAPMEPEHILLALLGQSESEPVRVLTACDVELSKARSRLESALMRRVRAGGERPTRVREHRASLRVRAALEAAMIAAAASGRIIAGKNAFAVDTTHFLVGMLSNDRSVGSRVLRRLGVTRSDVQSLLLQGQHNLEILLDEKSSRLIYEQIVDQIKAAVATGQIGPGYRLPSVRRLADSLDTAPGTVARAYGLLEDSGVVVTDGSRGTFVALASGQRDRGENSGTEIHDLLRSAAVAAFHVGMSGDELRGAFQRATKDIFPEPS